MHTYIHSGDNGDSDYVVGHWLDGKWQPLLAFATVQEAARWASFLNGGTEPKSEAQS